MTGEQMLPHVAVIIAERSAAYGDAATSTATVAARWSITLGHPVTLAQVVLCLIDRTLPTPSSDARHAGASAIAGVVERLIQLRSRVRQRLKENAEVVGTDEAFFEDEGKRQDLIDLYNEKAGILDGDADTEVDLASYAYQIWKNAIDANPAPQKAIPELPSVVYSTKAYVPQDGRHNGVLVYLRTAQGNDALAWVGKDGANVTQSQFEILKVAACEPDTPALLRQEDHHAMVAKGVEHIAAEEKQVGGQLGRPSGARFRTYERLKRHAEKVKGTLFDLPDLGKAIEEIIYRYPLRQSAIDTLNRQMKAGIDDGKLAELVMALREEDRLCLIHDEEHTR